MSGRVTSFWPNKTSPMLVHRLLAGFRSCKMSNDGATDINLLVQVIPYVYESTTRSQSQKRN